MVFKSCMRQPLALSLLLGNVVMIIVGIWLVWGAVFTNRMGVEVAVFGNGLILITQNLFYICYLFGDIE